MKTSRRKLRVVTLVDGIYAAGGAERLALEITMRLDASQFDRTLCVTREFAEPQACSEIRDAGVRLVLLERRSRKDIWSWRQLVELLRRERIDVLHSHKFGSNMWGSILGRFARVPVIVAHEHSWSFEGRPFRRLADRHLVARLASVVVAVSEADRQRMSSIVGIPPERIRFVPNGIPPLPAAAPAAIRDELGISSDALLGVAVAVFRPEKALDVLIDATALIVERCPDFHLLLVGSSSAAGEEPLRLLAKSLGIDRHVTVTGVRRDVAAVLGAADVTLLSSDREGSPLSVMEYMAAGKPVVATRVGGVPDLVRDGVDGILVQPRDPRAFAEAVLRLLESAELRTEMGTNARTRQRQEFDINITLRCIEMMYHELFAVTRRGRAEGWNHVLTDPGLGPPDVAANAGRSKTGAA